MLLAVGFIARLLVTGIRVRFGFDSLTIGFWITDVEDKAGVNVEFEIQASVAADKSTAGRSPEDLPIWLDTAFDDQIDNFVF